MAEFWERNRQFLTQVLGGAGVFLVLSYIVLGIGAESARDRKERKRLIERGTLLQRQFSDHGGLPEGSVKRLEKALAERRDDICIAVPGNLADQRNLATHFLKQKEYECARLDQIAEEQHVNVKMNLSDIDFHQRDTDDAEKYEEHWGELACLTRFLEAVLKAQFSEVLSVVIEGVETEIVRDEPAWSIVRYGVSVEVVGRFEHVVTLYAALTRPKTFLFLKTAELRPRKGGIDGELEGTLTAWGIRLLKTKERKQARRSRTTPRRYKR